MADIVSLSNINLELKKFHHMIIYQVMIIIESIERNTRKNFDSLLVLL